MDTLPQTQPTRPSPRSYARIARLYRILEYIAFGHALEAARTTFLESLAGCEHVGVFGAGDGRCFDSLLRSAPDARFVSIDSDAVMTSLAQERVARLGLADRVKFICEDVRSPRPVTTPCVYDGVVTQFFLDCFSADDLQQVVSAIGKNLVPGGPWLFADFTIPSTPKLARWRASLWISVLCAFFRWQAGHSLRSLPPMEATLQRNGFFCEREQSRSGGLIRSAVYRTRK